MNKTCTKCGETKPITEFHKDKSASSGLVQACKTCTSFQRKVYRAQNRDKMLDRDKAYYEQNKDKVLARRKVYRESPSGRFVSYRCAAKTRGIPFLLTEEEFNGFWQLPCYYCGAEMETIGLDRVDNDGPYHIDNVVSCCPPCNSSKCTNTLDEWLEKKNDREKETEVPCNA